MTVRLKLWLLVVTALTISGPVHAQSWQPIDFGVPFPPHGTHICAQGGGERICLALYCDAPGDGLRVGFINTLLRSKTPGMEMDFFVDNPLSSSETFNPMAVLDRLPTYPYFVATGTLDAVRAPQVLQEMRAGNRVFLDVYGDESIGLPLRGSGREIARALRLCGPVRAAAATSAEVASPTAATVPPPSEPTAALPAQPVIPAVDVGSAMWEPVPPDPAEDVFGTQLCFPASADAPASRCLQLACFVQGTAPTVFYTESTLPTGPENLGAAYPVTLTGAEGEQIELDLSVAESRTLIAVPTLRNGVDLARLSNVLAGDGPLRIEAAGGAISVQSAGWAAEAARLGQLCTLPAETDLAQPPTDAAPAPTAPSPTARSGTEAITFAEDERGQVSAEAEAAMEAVHGAEIAEYVATVGRPLSGWGARYFDLGGGRALLFSQLCGGGGWFSADGCLVYANVNPGNGWQQIFSDDTLAYGGTLSVSFDARRDGFPDILVGGGKTWTWTNGQYR